MQTMALATIIAMILRMTRAVSESSSISEIETIGMLRRLRGSLRARVTRFLTRLIMITPILNPMIVLTSCLHHSKLLNDNVCRSCACNRGLCACWPTERRVQILVLDDQSLLQTNIQPCRRSDVIDPRLAHIKVHDLG